MDVVQLVEQSTFNRLVAGSSPVILIISLYLYLYTINLMLFKLFNIPFSFFTFQNLDKYSIFFTRQSRQTYTLVEVQKNSRQLFPSLTPNHYNLFKTKLNTLKHIPSSSTVIVSKFKSIFYPSRYVFQLQFIHDNYSFLNTYIYIIIEGDISEAIDFSYPTLVLDTPYLTSKFDKPRIKPIYKHFSSNITKSAIRQTNTDKDKLVDPYFRKSAPCHFYSYTENDQHVFHAIFNFPIHTYIIFQKSKDINDNIIFNGLLDSAPIKK